MRTPSIVSRLTFGALALAGHLFFASSSFAQADSQLAQAKMQSAANGVFGSGARVAVERAGSTGILQALVGNPLFRPQPAGHGELISVDARIAPVTMRVIGTPRTVQRGVERTITFSWRMDMSSSGGGRVRLNLRQQNRTLRAIDFTGLSGLATGTATIVVRGNTARVTALDIRSSSAAFEFLVQNPDIRRTLGPSVAAATGQALIRRLALQVFQGIR